MKALQLQAVGRVALIEAQEPIFVDDQILVRTGAATICTSDLIDVRDNPFSIRLPVVMGHEGSGTVAAVGTAVEGFRVGDRVATHPVHPCGVCANCRRGMAHLCQDMGHFGINLPGTFAEYYLVRADRARQIPDHVPFTVAALAEPLCVCLEALAQANVESGGRLLIVGDGPFGVLIARLALSLSLDKVVIAGRHDFRLGYAGGAVQINTRGCADLRARLRAEVGDSGFDAAILAVGSVQGARDALALLRAKGRLVVFAPSGETPVDFFDLHVRELEIVGACNDQDRFDEAVTRLANPALALADLVTHIFPIEAYQEAFDLAATGREEAMKVALTISEEGA